MVQQYTRYATATMTTSDIPYARIDLISDILVIKILDNGIRETSVIGYGKRIVRMIYNGIRKVLIMRR